MISYIMKIQIYGFFLGRLNIIFLVPVKQVSNHISCGINASDNLMVVEQSVINTPKPELLISLPKEVEKEFNDTALRRASQ